MRDSLPLLEETEANSKLQALPNVLFQSEKNGDVGELSMEVVKLEDNQHLWLILTFDVMGLDRGKGNDQG